MGAPGRRIRNTPVQVLFGTAEDAASALSAVTTSSELAELVRSINAVAYENEDAATAAVEIVARCPNLVDLYICLPTIVGLHARLHPRGLSSLHKLTLALCDEEGGLQGVPIDEIFRFLQLMPALNDCAWQSTVTNYERLPNTAAAFMRLPERLFFLDMRASATIPVFSAANSTVRTYRLPTKLEDLQFLRTVDWDNVVLPLTSISIKLPRLSTVTDGAIPTVTDPALFSSVLSACTHLQVLKVIVFPSNTDYLSVLRAMLTVRRCRLRSLDIYILRTPNEHAQTIFAHAFRAVIDLLCECPPAIAGLRVLHFGKVPIQPELQATWANMLAFCRARRIRCDHPVR